MDRLAVNLPSNKVSYVTCGHSLHFPHLSETGLGEVIKPPTLVLFCYFELLLTFHNHIPASFAKTSISILVAKATLCLQDCSFFLYYIPPSVAKLFALCNFLQFSVYNQAKT